MNPLYSFSLEIEDISHYLLDCHHFYHQRIDLVRSLKSNRDNFPSMSGNSKKDVLLYDDSCFDETKTKFILEVTIKKNTKNFHRFSGSFSNNAFIIMENVHTYTISKQRKPFKFFSSC